MPHRRMGRYRARRLPMRARCSMIGVIAGVGLSCPSCWRCWPRSLPGSCCLARISITSGSCPARSWAPRSIPSLGYGPIRVRGVRSAALIRTPAFQAPIPCWYRPAAIPPRAGCPRKRSMPTCPTCPNPPMPRLKPGAAGSTFCWRNGSGWRMPMRR